MKRYIAILGTLLIVGIFLSGSAVAQTWHYAISVAGSYQCTNPNNAVGAPDGNHATIGQNPDKLGCIVLDLGAGNEIPTGYYLFVFASSAIPEEYGVAVRESEDGAGIYLGSNTDTKDHFFKTPWIPGKSWRYVEIVGISGDNTGLNDPIYGPEVDAVGWYEP